MTEPIPRTKVGLFVLMGVAILIISILIFGGDRAFLKSYVTYKVKFPSTQGLDSGSVVSLAGKEVGNVKNIEFDSDTQLVAVLNIDKDFQLLVKSDAVASIRTQGALGDKYIYISPGSTSGSTLPAGEVIRSETAPDIMEILSGKGPDMTTVVGILKELNQLLHNLNSDGKSALLMENLVVASHDVSKLMNEPNLKESLSHLRNILKKIDKGEGTLGQLINDQTLHERLVGLLGETPRNKYLKPLLREAIKENEQKR
jgi:phospholipid/cholesterol/gamma-HCH transport system substrate-binding protein